MWTGFELLIFGNTQAGAQLLLCAMYLCTQIANKCWTFQGEKKNTIQRGSGRNVEKRAEVNTIYFFLSMESQSLHEIVLSWPSPPNGNYPFIKVKFLQLCPCKFMKCHWKSAKLKVEVKSLARDKPWIISTEI